MRSLLDFIIKDQYLTKISAAKDKIRFIKQNKALSLQQLAETADLYDISNKDSGQAWECHQEKSFSRNETSSPFRNTNSNFQRKIFNPSGKKT